MVMPKKRTVVVAAGISAALLASSSAFAVANGIFGAQRTDPVGKFDVTDQHLAPVDYSIPPTTRVPSRPAVTTPTTAESTDVGSDGSTPAPAPQVTKLRQSRPPRVSHPSTTTAKGTSRRPRRQRTCRRRRTLRRRPHPTITTDPTTTATTQPTPPSKATTDVATRPPAAPARSRRGRRSHLRRRPRHIGDHRLGRHDGCSGNESGECPERSPERAGSPRSSHFPPGAQSQPHDNITPARDIGTRAGASSDGFRTACAARDAEARHFERARSDTTFRSGRDPASRRPRAGGPGSEAGRDNAGHRRTEAATGTADNDNACELTSPNVVCA